MKYEVLLESQIEEFAYLIVEAKDQVEAERIALSLAEDGNVYWDDYEKAYRINTNATEVNEYEGEDEAYNK